LENYKVPEWAVQQIVRETGLWEDVCKHGVGHPNAEYLSCFPPSERRVLSVHGCDGCCSNPVMSKSVKRRLKAQGASREEQHARYIDCGPGAWDDRE